MNSLKSMTTTSILGASKKWVISERVGMKKRESRKE